MPIFSKKSLELLRETIDLVEVLSTYVPLKRAGAFYKGCCPFHEEKTPSFVIKKTDTHYHCYGCGAHGDAIQFLMSYQNLTFVEAVESLAERFQVYLEKDSRKEANEPDKRKLKSALETAHEFFQFCLLHTKEAQGALQYLYDRGIDLEFIKTFRLGYALAKPHVFQRYMQEKGVSSKDLKLCGLITEQNRDFFIQRIIFPIQNSIGAIIGFSARKFIDTTFGGKYINTPETALFKKSKVLFGLNFCRWQIVKQKKAILVEGQIDALRLIHCGFVYALASQGTAFGQGHVKELVNLGVREVFIAFDSDAAGQLAAMKVGDSLQKEGIEVKVLDLPKGEDPDSILRKKGPESFKHYIKIARDYLTFLIETKSKDLDLSSPAHKNEFIESILQQLKEWKHPLMIHESLKKISRLTNTPESVIQGSMSQSISLTEELPQVSFSEKGDAGSFKVDPDQVLESDFLRWLLLMGESKPQFIEIAKLNLKSEDFSLQISNALFLKYLERQQEKKPLDLLSFTIDCGEETSQFFIEKMMEKKVDLEKSEDLFVDTVQKILDRNWLRKREEIQLKLLSGKCSQEDATLLAKQFDEIKQQRPRVCFPS